MDYQEFLASIGWGVELATHTGFKGTIDSGDTCGSLAPYWASHDMEMIFQVCTLIPNNPTYPDHAHKQKLSLSGNCTIIWVEDLFAFSPHLIWKKMRHPSVLIVIVPLECGLYMI